MSFYDKFLLLCKQKGVSPSRAAIEMGFNKGTISVWKSKNNKGEDAKPSTPIVDKMVEYFGVTADYLLGSFDDSQQKNKPTTENDDELNGYLEELRNRSEMRMLFKLAKGATKEEVEQAVKVIEALRK